jgi:hypothetical protein
VLLLDDGELSRIHQEFRDLDVDLEQHRGEVLLEDLEGPYHVVFATVRRTLAFEGSVDLSNLAGKPVWVAVHGQDFLPLRVRLRKMGVSFLVQSSVSSDALRLLLTQTLHLGSEKRGLPRLPVGSVVNCRDEGGTPFQAVLLDLGRDGCRLISEHSAPPGAALSVGLPSQLSGGEELTLPGQIQRADPHGDSSRSLLTVSFDNPNAESLELLDAILAGKVIGTVVTRLGDDLDEDTAPLTVVSKATPRAEPKPMPARAAYPHQRRRRVLYAREVTALLGSNELAVLARDLSIGGMRAEPLPELSVGTSLELALYGPSGAEPVLVQAVVARDDGPRGTVFHFEDMAPGERSRLEGIIAKATELGSPANDQGDEPFIVAEVRERGS